MELNLLQPTLSSTANKEITELQFYRYYLLILNETQNILTTKQLDMIAYLMSKGTEFKCKGTGVLEEISKEMYMSKQHVTNVRKQLIEKQIIGEDGALSRIFSPLVHLIAQKKEIKLTLPIKIKQ